MSIVVPTSSAQVVDPKTGAMTPVMHTLLQRIANSANVLNRAVGITNASVSSTASNLSGQISASQSALQAALQAASGSLTNQLNLTATNLQSSIDANGNAISVANSSIASNTTAISAHTTAINTNTADIANNASAITALANAYGALVIPRVTQPHGEHVTIDYAENRAYTVVQFSERAWKVTGVAAKCSTGSCTVTVAVDGVNLGGGSNSVTTTESVVTHSTSNTVAAGATIVVTVSSNLAAELVAVSIVGTTDLDH